MTGAGNDTRLAGKVVAVTGAARGLGAEIARHCARAGARVAVCDIAREDGRRTAAEIVRAGGDARYFELDVADEGAWQRALVELKDAFGALHVLVNNAGIIARSPLATLSVADWRRVIEINLTGPFIGTKLTAPLIRDAGGGSIINISSVAGFAGLARAPAALRGIRVFTARPPGAPRASARRARAQPSDRARARRSRRVRPDRRSSAHPEKIVLLEAGSGGWNTGQTQRRTGV